MEAFNLKAAIEYNLGNVEAAQEALSDMPPREEGELDAVTLHNTALVHMDKEPSTGFKKLNWLLVNPPFPPEAFGNLLLLYCKHGCYDLAADVMAENAHLTVRYLSPELYEFLDASIAVQVAPEEAYRKFDALAARYIEELRKHTKGIQDARLGHDNEGIKSALKAYDDTLEKYVPALMGQARIYWDRGNYPQVEKIFRQSAEFASEHDVWKLNVAHTFFLQDGKYREAIRYYEPLVKAKKGGTGRGLLDVNAMVLANLCVSYIMMSLNEEAEEIMRLVEAAEEEVLAAEPDKQVFHLCIINLVIGTLYCSKGNYEFGINRVVKSLDPLPRKLGTDTWYYVKRCLLALAEGLAKHMVLVPDTVIEDVVSFLEEADTAGKTVMAVINQAAALTSTMNPATGADGAGGADGAVGGAGSAAAGAGGSSTGVGGATGTLGGTGFGGLSGGQSRTVTQEARLLKKLYLHLQDEH